MTIILFIIVLLVIVVAHEFGHFIAAKYSNMKVEEFGVGFPPKVWGIQKGETLYSVNALPFGGFVKILGENPDDPNAVNDPRSFSARPKWQQAIVLVAGVTFNVLLAWILFSVGFMSGMPTSIESLPEGAEVRDVRLAITHIAPQSPAEEAGLRPGDAIEKVSFGTETLSSYVPDALSTFISDKQGETLVFVVRRGEETRELSVVPKEGIVEGRAAIGIGMSEVGTAYLNPFEALWYGAVSTWNALVAILFGFFDLIADAFKGTADVASLTGPVGIAGMVGQASEFGFVYLLSFTAFISLNLAVINLIPFPALDGGRLLFLLIEAVKGSPIRSGIANIMNAVGFFLLIGLMIFVTFQDIARLL